MAAANHGEGIGAGEERCARDFADGFFTGIDEIGVFFAFERIGTDSQHPILTLQNDFHARRNIIGDQGRHADPEVYVEPVAQFLGDALDDTLALVAVLDGFRACLRAVDCFFLTVFLSIRFSNNSRLENSFHINAGSVNQFGIQFSDFDHCSTSAMVTFAADAIMGLKFRAVLR